MSAVRVSVAAAASPLKGGVFILLIDDEVIVCEPLAERLVELGYRVTQASDGAEGLDILKSIQPTDLLISDVGLPGHMNGRQLADVERELWPRLKVLFVTGYAGEAASATGLAERGMEVMIKPFGLDEFELKVAAMTLGCTAGPAHSVVTWELTPSCFPLAGTG